MLRFEHDDVTRPAVISLLEKHLAHARAHSPPDSVHALDLDGLRHPEFNFWTAWSGDALAGFGGLKLIAPGHGEIKSMHTAEALRGRGTGGRILDYLITQARGMALTRLSLETGTMDAYIPARALYESRGFARCAPLPGYPPADPLSCFYTRTL